MSLYISFLKYLAPSHEARSFKKENLEMMKSDSELATRFDERFSH